MLLGRAIGVDLVQRRKGLCDCSDAADEQNYIIISASFHRPPAGPESPIIDFLLTARENHPNEVHEKVITPEIQHFRS